VPHVSPLVLIFSISRKLKEFPKAGMRAYARRAPQKPGLFKMFCELPILSFTSVYRIIIIVYLDTTQTKFLKRSFTKMENYLDSKISRFLDLETGKSAGSKHWISLSNMRNFIDCGLCHKYRINGLFFA